MSCKLLSVKNLSVSAENKQIISAVDLSIEAGQVHFIKGPNGSGKSTLAMTIAGHPDYYPVAGEIKFNNENIVDYPLHLRAQKGIFLAWQHPVIIPGVTIRDYLSVVYNQLSLSGNFREELSSCLNEAGFSPTIGNREINVGFSGGERKRLEMAQLLFCRPRLAILDELDSGLDKAGMIILSQIIHKMRSNGQSTLLITHSGLLEDAVKPDFTHTMKNGRLML